MPLNASATCTAQSVRPSPHSRVPSSGSTIHTRSRSSRTGESFDSSDRIASSGRAAARRARIRSLLSRSPSSLVAFARLQLERGARRLRARCRPRARGRPLSSSPARRVVVVVVVLGGGRREQRRGRAAQHARVDRLHEREVDVGAARDERVVAAVEQQQDARVRQPPARFLEAQVDRDGDAAHVADLEVEHDEIGLELGERVAHVLAARDLDDFLARARRTPTAPGRAPTSPRRQPGSSSSVGETRWRARRPIRGSNRSPADLAQRREVVDVAGEIRHVGDRRRIRPAPCTPSTCVPLELGDLAEVGEVLVARRQPRGRALDRRPAPARPRRRAARRVLRRRTSGARGSRSARRSADRCVELAGRRTRASSIASRRGDVTSTNAGFGCREQRLDRERRVAEARLHPFERAEERDDVVDRPPTRRPARPCAGTSAPRRSRPSRYAARRHHQHPEDAVVEQAQEPARRVEEVERVTRRRRVDDDEVEVRRCSWSSCSFSIAMYSCVPPSAPDTLR